MEEEIKEVKSFYDATVQSEWERIAGRPEFLLTCRYLQRYLKAGDRVLDIGGGPGRYSLHLAQKGCDVTLFDLSGENVKFAAGQAAEAGLALQTVCGDAREADKLTDGQYDVVLLMGPLYHLLDEADRIRAVEAALRCLKPGGLLFASFINLYAVLVYYMKQAPAIITTEFERRFIAEHLIPQKSYAGDAFTKAYFIRQEEIEPFMEQFPLEKLHLMGQEGITGPCEGNTMGHAEITEQWLDLAESLCEKKELLSWSEHLLYIGRKLPEPPTPARRHLVILIGPHAVGKMTVGQTLAKRTGLKLLHNHMSIELTRKFFNVRETKEGRYLNSLIRREILKTVAESELPGLIFTYMVGFGEPSDFAYLERIMRLYRSHGADCCVVELCADFEVRIERNKTENRLANKESKRDVAHSEAEMRDTGAKHRLNSYDGERLPFENYLKIDNTNLSPETVAGMIQAHFHL